LIRSARWRIHLRPPGDPAIGGRAVILRRLGIEGRDDARPRDRQTCGILIIQRVQERRLTDGDVEYLCFLSLGRFCCHPHGQTHQCDARNNHYWMKNFTLHLGFYAPRREPPIDAERRTSRSHAERGNEERDWGLDRWYMELFLRPRFLPLPGQIYISLGSEIRSRSCEVEILQEAERAPVRNPATQPMLSIRRVSHSRRTRPPLE